MWGCGAGFGEGNEAVFYFFLRDEGAAGVLPSVVPAPPGRGSRRLPSPGAYPGR